MSKKKWLRFGKKATRWTIKTVKKIAKWAFDNKELITNVALHNSDALKPYVNPSHYKKGKMVLFGANAIFHFVKAKELHKKESDI